MSRRLLFPRYCNEILQRFSVVEEATRLLLLQILYTERSSWSYLLLLHYQTIPLPFPSPHIGREAVRARLSSRLLDRWYVAVLALGFLQSASEHLVSPLALHSPSSYLAYEQTVQGCGRWTCQRGSTKPSARN
jgi:hypothetical protein